MGLLSADIKHNYNNKKPTQQFANDDHTKLDEFYHIKHLDQQVDASLLERSHTQQRSSVLSLGQFLRTEATSNQQAKLPG